MNVKFVFCLAVAVSASACSSDSSSGGDDMGVASGGGGGGAEGGTPGTGGSAAGGSASGGGSGGEIGAGGDAIGGAGGDASGGAGGEASGGAGGEASGGAGGEASGGAGGEPGLAPFTQEEVQALVEARCTPCHISSASAGMSLADDFTANTVGVAAAESDLSRIEPGDRESSYLYLKIMGTQESGGGSGSRMPLGGAPLSDEEIERIGLWIDSL